MAGETIKQRYMTTVVIQIFHHKRPRIKRCL